MSGCILLQPPLYLLYKSATSFGSNNLPPFISLVYFVCAGTVDSYRTPLVIPTQHKIMSVSVSALVAPPSPSSSSLRISNSSSTLVSPPPYKLPASSSSYSSNLRERRGIDLYITLPPPPFFGGVPRAVSVAVPRPTDNAQRVRGSKGFVQPHINHLPRRKRKPKVAALVSDDDEDEGNSSSHRNVKPGPKLPPPPGVEIKSDDSPFFSTAHPSSSSTHASSSSLHVQRQNLVNLPRRLRRPPGVAEIARQKRAGRDRRRCLQEVGSGTGVFVAFEDDDQEDRGVYAAVVKIGVAVNKESVVSQEKGGFLRLDVSSEVDDGTTGLHETQIQAACEFLSHSRGPVLIVAPTRERAVDALSLAVCHLTLGLISGALVPVPTHLCASHTREHGTAPYSAVHTFVMGLHDLPGDDEDGDGLMDEWRGVISADGMGVLVRALAVRTGNGI